MWIARTLVASFALFAVPLATSSAVARTMLAAEQPAVPDLAPSPDLAPTDEARPDPGIADPGLDSGELQDPDTIDPGAAEELRPNSSTPDGPAAKPAELEPLKPIDPAAARTKLLTGLYDRLAAAKSKDEATALETAIEHIWAEPESATAGLLIARAGVLSQSGDTATAYRLLDAAIKIAPDDAAGLTRRAYMRLTEQDFGKALADLQQALALDPRNYRAIGALAQILKEFGNKPAALKAFRTLKAADPFADGADDAIRELEHAVEGSKI